MNLFRKRKTDINLSPFEFDWGEVTPDLVNSDKGEYTNISNHYLVNNEGRKLSPIFSTGRVIWYSKHLPHNLKPLVLLDIRGQDEISFNTDVKKTGAKKPELELKIQQTTFN